MRYLWRDFVDLSMGLEQNGMAPAVVTWQSLQAWCVFTRTAIEPWEARTLIQLGIRRAAIDSEGVNKGSPPQ